MKIYLASQSPRRRKLLKQMGVQFSLLKINTPEKLIKGESPINYSKRVTEEKLIAAWAKVQQEELILRPVLCADTEVILDDEICGKPKNYEHAYHMLKKFSGRSHEVITTTGVKLSEYQQLAVNQTTVYFKSIPDKEIHHYLRTGDYKDKAGGYGIQSYIGQFIYRIEGCFFSVMGLPLNTVRELLLTLPAQ